MKVWLGCFLLIQIVLTAAPFRMKERIEKAKIGDYIVTEAGKTITVLAIRANTPHSLILEEISVPTQNLKKRPDSWPDWVKSNAPGHSSWSMMEIDPQSGQVLECFSFSRSAWLQLSQKESLVATLLYLPMTKVAPEKQRKIGPPPMPGEPDFRKNWVPPLVFEGKKIESPHFDVYETVWPADESDLSNQDVMLYFDRDKSLPFPFWIQVQTSHATAALRLIDSGKNLPVIHRKIPRRVPEFIGLPRKTDNRLLLNVKSPKYYKQFELYAIDITLKEKQILPIPHSLIHGEGEWKTVAIELDDLNATLESEHQYHWLLIPIGFSDSYTETDKPFVWTSS
ncbi:MAG: hypothetical protein KGQ49_00915 [Verrucomicrobia bacterium]|nr:hypothetical protein [Verrucomicrobiota bacterium]MBU6445943.1 hypothetical protein [Verrucomicrobiota bacterium]